MTPEQNEFLLSKEFKARLTAAIVEVEEDRLCKDCVADLCEQHEEFYEAPIGCGDADDIIKYLTR